MALTEPGRGGEQEDRQLKLVLRRLCGASFSPMTMAKSTVASREERDVYYHTHYRYRTTM